MKHIKKFNESLEDSSLNEGKNSFDYEWGEGVYINGSMSHKIYYDKEIQKLSYQYPGKSGGNTVDGILSNNDIDDLINLLQKYKGKGY